MAYHKCYECGKMLSVDEIEMEYCSHCGADWGDDYFEGDEEDRREREEEELAERASMCKCGAWQFSKSGSVIHVADCCCGAE